MSPHLAFLRLMQFLAVCALPLLTLGHAHATGGPHTADIFLDSKTKPPNPNDPAVDSTRLLELIPGQAVSITGKMKFRINVLTASAGDSCLLA